MVVELPSADPSGGLSGIIVLMVLMLCLLLGPLIIWRVRRRRGSQQSLAETRDDQLFLKVAYTTDRDADGPRQGYLRSLTSERATLVVADRALRKGSNLRLDLGSLRGQDGFNGPPIHGKVTRMKSLGGSPENLLVNIQFIEHNVPVHEILQQQSDFSSTAGPLSPL